jgi:hypothetical protein
MFSGGVALDCEGHATLGKLELMGWGVARAQLSDEGALRVLGKELLDGRVRQVQGLKILVPFTLAPSWGCDPW